VANPVKVIVGVRAVAVNTYQTSLTAPTQADAGATEVYVVAAVMLPAVGEQLVPGVSVIAPEQRSFTWALAEPHKATRARITSMALHLRTKGYLLDFIR